MNEITKVIELTDDVVRLMKMRSRELDRREQFDKEISEQINEILNKKNHERN